MRSMIVLLVCTVWLLGCEVIRCQICSHKDRATSDSPLSDTATTNPPAPVLVSLTARGYGALDSSVTNLAQQKLLAIRASELDAFRSMIEQVKGVHLWSNSRVRDFVSQDDHINSVTDSYLAKAKILSQGMLEEGIYETVLSLDINDPFNRLLDSQTVDPDTVQRQEPEAESTVDMELLPTQDLTRRHHDLARPTLSEETMP